MKSLDTEKEATIELNDNKETKFKIELENGSVIEILESSDMTRGNGFYWGVDLANDET